MVVAAGFLIVIVVALYVALPLFGPRTLTEASDSEREDLLARRDVLYREIADLDFEHQAGKVDERDFQGQREEYLDDAAAILEELDRRPAMSGDPREESRDALDEELEAEIRRLRRKARAR